MNALHTAYTTLRVAILALVIIVSLLQLPKVAAQSPRQSDLTNHVYIPFVIQGTGAQLPSPVPTEPAPSTQPTPAPTVVPTPIPTEEPIDAAAYQAELMQRINAYRVEKGCPAAVEQSMLMTGTRAWNEHLVETSDFRHSPMGYYAQFGYDSSNGRQSPVEVIHVGAATPADAVQAWIDDPAHERLLRWCTLSGGTYEIGASYIEPGYWVAAIGWLDQ